MEKVKGFIVKVSLGNIVISLDDWDNCGKDDNDNFTQKAKVFAVNHMMEFVEELGSKLDGSIGEKVLVNESGPDFYELNESLSDIDFEDYDDVSLYILIKKEIFIGPNPVNKIFIDIMSYKLENDKYVYTLEEHRNLWPNDWFHKNELYPLVKSNLNYLKINIPKNPIKYLERSYGNWKIPDNKESPHVSEINLSI